MAGRTILEEKNRYDVDRISKLASNESRYGCSSDVRSAVEKALDEIQDYPDPIARELCTELAKRNDVNESEIIIVAGSESILSILCRSLLSNSDNIVTSDATFDGIYVQGSVMGAEIKKVPVTPRYGFDTTVMLESIDENTKIIYLANPNNPTGTYIGKSEYESFLEQVPVHVLVIADEAYFEFARYVDDYPHALNYRKEKVIITRTFSKGYGHAGFRIGYAIAPLDLREQLMTIKLTFEPTTLVQVAALTALKDDIFLEKNVKLVNEERKNLSLFFDDHNFEYVLSISNSVMMICKSVQDAMQFTQGMLETGVILRRLNAFGLPHCVCITIGIEHEINHFKDSFNTIQKN